MAPTAHAPLPFALFALSTGASLLVVRYGLLGLMYDPGRFGDAVMVGGAAGLIVTGIQMLRAAVRRGPRASPVAAVLACLLGPALVFGVYAAIGPARVVESEDTALQPVEVPGLALALPAWPVREAGTQWHHGNHVRDEPGGRGRFIDLQWSVSMPVEVEELAGIYGKDFQSVTRETNTVVGRDVTTLLLAAPASGKHVAVTSWQCPDDPRNFLLTSFLGREPPQILALHRRVLASARCQPVPGGHPAPVFPRFAPPGAQRIDNPAALVFQGAQGEVYTMSAGLPGRELIDKVALNPNFATTAVTVEFPVRDVVLPAAPTVQGDRRTWFGRARGDAGDAVRVGITVWHCPGPDLSFVGMFAGPEAVVEAQALQILESAQCP